MTQIIGWVIWSFVVLLAVWGVFSRRARAKFGENLDEEVFVVTPSLWIISILFLIFDWHKLHLLWIVPIAFVATPFLQKIPIVSPLILFVTGIFQKIVLVGVQPVEVELSEREENDEDREEERDEDEDEDDIEVERITEDVVPVTGKDPLGRYMRIRAVGRNLTGPMMKHAPKFVITKTAGDLNLRGPKGILVFDEESDTPFMMDRCFYDIYWEGKNLVSHFMDSEDFGQLTEEEQTIVQGMATAYYSLFEVLDVDPSEGTIELDDLLGEGTYTIRDVNMSRSARTGYLLAARIKQIEGIYMTTGAACPFEAEKKQLLLHGLEPRKIPVGRKKKTKRIQRSDYSAYFFKKHKQIGGIEFLTAE